MGAAVGSAWWVAGRVWAPLLAAGVAVTADLILTGALHFDGLVDTADGLLPHAPDAATRLDVMQAPDVGAFGLATGIVALGLRWAGLAAGPIGVEGIALVAGLWCLSRTCLVPIVGVVPYARTEGLASAFSRHLDGAGIAVSGLGLAVSVTLLFYARGFAGIVIVLAACVAGIGVVLLAKCRIGGFTGDVLGAAVVVGETVGLLAATARI